MPRILLALTLALVVMPEAHPQTGITPDRIVIGQSCALRGSAAALGSGTREGLLAWFDRLNDDGGLLGRLVELRTYDDGYEPALCEMNTAKLIDEDQVFCIIGEVGTPTSEVAAPLCGRAGVPFIAPMTGAGFLREAGQQHVINLRASYAQEAEAMARALVDEAGLRRIACFHQNDGFGRSGLQGIEDALRRRGLELVARGTYRRNTIAIASALEEMERAEPEAVIMVGTYRPCAAFIKAARGHEAFAGTIFCHYSFVGTTSLLAELDRFADRVVVAQVVPSPADDSLAVAREFRRDIAARGIDPDLAFTEFEGYLAARMLTAAFLRIRGRLTRENLLRVFEEQGQFDLGGVNLVFGPGDNQGSDDVFLGVLEGGRLVRWKP